MVSLLKGFLSHLEDKSNLLLVISDILHGTELGLQVVQIRVELLSHIAHGISAAASWCLRDLTSCWSWLDLRVLVLSIELINFIIDLVHGLIEIADLVVGVPTTDKLLTFIELPLHVHESPMLLNQQIILELLNLALILIYLEEQLNIVVG